MSETDDARNKADEVKGKAKETLGSATGDEDLEAEGRTDQTKANLKQAADKAKDAAKRTLGE